MHKVWQRSTADIRLLLKEERQNYKKAKRNSASDWRKMHINTMLKSARKRKGRSKKDMDCFLRLRKMKQREETRRRRKARGKGFSGGLRAIHQERTLADGTTQLQTITDQRAVERACQQENQRRYDQTRHPYITPPMAEPLYSTFTGSHRQRNSIDLLEGRFPIPAEIDPASKAFLRQYRLHKNFSFLSMEVSPQDHFRFWSKMNEDKGSEPHGLHNGHFKAALQCPLLYHCDAIFRNIPLITGFVPENWKNLMNFAIAKKEGDFRPSKMRTIQMMNPKFQANNKKMGGRDAICGTQQADPPGTMRCEEKTPSKRPGRLQATGMGSPYPPTESSGMDLQ